MTTTLQQVQHNNPNWDWDLEGKRYTYEIYTGTEGVYLLQIFKKTGKVWIWSVEADKLLTMAGTSDSVSIAKQQIK